MNKKEEQKKIDENDKYVIEKIQEMYEQNGEKEEE